MRVGDETDVLEYVEGYDLRVITDQLAAEGEIIPEALSLHIAAEIAQALHFARTKHLAAHAPVLGQGLGRIGQVAGGGVVGRAVGPFFGQLDALHQGLGPLHGGAPSRVLKMLDEVEKSGDADAWGRAAALAAGFVGARFRRRLIEPHS